MTCLQAAGEVLVANGRPRWGVRLWGMANAVFSGLSPLTTAFGATYRSALASVRQHLGEASFAQAWSEGEAMTDEQALAELEQALVPELRGHVESQVSQREKLTAREREVLRLLARGFTNVQIAHALVISSNTVGTHVNAIFNKLYVSSRSAATRYTLEQHLV